MANLFFNKFIRGKTEYVFKIRPFQSRAVMRNFFDLLMCVILISCAERPKVDLGLSSIQDVPKDSTTLYFPLVDSDENISGRLILDTSTNTWISEVLFALREPVLMNLSTRLEVYRLTIIGSKKHPFCIRFFNTDKGGKFVSKYTDGYGGYYPGRLIFDSCKILTDVQWVTISKKFDELKFWDMNSLLPSTGKDGSDWILEGYKNGLYKGVARWSPEWSSDRGFCELSETIIEMSGLNDHFHFFE